MVCFDAGRDPACKVARQQCREPVDERGDRVDGHVAPNYDAPELRRPIYDASRQGRRHRGPGGDPERTGAIRSEAAPVIAARRR